MITLNILFQIKILEIKNLLFKRNNKNRRDKKDLFKGMEFGKAVDVLHKKLNSFKI